MKSLSFKIQQLEESQTLAFTALARQLRETGADVVSLTAGEPDFPTPMHIKMTAIRAIEENFTHYTANNGIPELLKAIKQKFERDNRLTFDVSQIVVSNGAKHSLYNALQAICNKGDEVVIAAPYWVSYPEMVALAGGESVPVVCPASNGFKLQPADLEKAITPKTKWIILCSPSNPTGAAYTEAEIKALTDVLVKHERIWVLSDDIYEHLVYDGFRFTTPAAVEPRVKARTLTLEAFWQAVARMGGPLGRRGDGPPGWRTVWRGWRHLEELTEGARLFAPHGPT